MSKVYVLYTKHKEDSHQKIRGVVTNVNSAAKFAKIQDKYLFYSYQPYELNDPELLNRIAKESEKKND